MGETALTWSARKQKPGTWIVSIEVHVGGRRTHDVCVVQMDVMREREMRRGANALLELERIKQGETDG